MKPSVFVSVLAMLAALALSACAANPVTGGREFTLMSEAKEIQRGRQSDPEVRAWMGVCPDMRFGLQAVADRTGGLIPATELAVLNGVAANSQPPAGQRIKMVIASE